MMEKMEPDLSAAIRLIGNCLAPFQPGRGPLLSAAAEKIRQWEVVWRLGRDRYISPLIYLNLKKAGLDHLMPEEIRHWYQRLYLNNAALNSLRLQQVIALTSGLRAHGTKVLYLKGASMIMAGDYPDPGHRLFTDIDLYIDFSRRSSTLDFMREQTLWREHKVPGVSDLDESFWQNQWDTLLEVHWSFKPLNGVPGETARARLWDKARDLEYKGQAVTVPSPEDRYIQSAIHSTARHAFNSPFLFMTIADLAHLAARTPGGLDWEDLAQALIAQRMLEHVIVVTAVAAELTQDPPLLDGLARLQNHRPGVESITRPFTDSLLTMLTKPWVFASSSEMKLLRSKSLRRRAGAAFAALSRLVSPLPQEEPNPDNKEQALEYFAHEIRYRKKLFDPDFLKYLWQLRRFYRKINYQSFE